MGMVQEQVDVEDIGTYHVVIQNEEVNLFNEVNIDISMDLEVIVQLAIEI